MGPQTFIERARLQPYARSGAGQHLDSSWCAASRLIALTNFGPTTRRVGLKSFPFSRNTEPQEQLSACGAAVNHASPPMLSAVPSFVNDPSWRLLALFTLDEECSAVLCLCYDQHGLRLPESEALALNPPIWVISRGAWTR